MHIHIVTQLYVCYIEVINCFSLIFRSEVFELLFSPNKERHVEINELL